MQFKKQTNDLINAQTCTTLVIDISCHKIHTSGKFLGSCQFATLGLRHLRQLCSLSNGSTGIAGNMEPTTLSNFWTKTTRFS